MSVTEIEGAARFAFKRDDGQYDVVALMRAHVDAEGDHTAAAAALCEQAIEVVREVRHRVDQRIACREARQRKQQLTDMIKSCVVQLARLRERHPELRDEEEEAEASDASQSAASQPVAETVKAA